LSDPVNEESRVFDDKLPILTFMLSDQNVDYEISLLDFIEFKRIKTNDKPTLEPAYPTAWQNEAINAGGFKYILDSPHQFSMQNKSY
jgi:hypothetical protein